MTKPVGPVLRMSDDVDAIVAAIVDDNPGQEVTIVDQGAYTRVSADGELRVTRESIERYLGRDFEMRQLEGLMSAFAGRIDMTSQEVRWRLTSEDHAEARPPRPQRRLKTWSSLGQLGRIPSEYEVVTHNLNYTTRPNRTSALESNPTTPANMWLLTYRDKSPLRADDWRGFRDPDEITYRKYVTMQDEQETVVEGVLDEYGSAGHDASLPKRWVECLATLFTPTRFPVHALQMCTAYLGHMAPASYISNCAVFGAGDLLRRVSLVAYRTRQLADATKSSIGSTERLMWQRNEAWQPAREALEKLLTAYDWGECFTAMNLVLRPTLDQILVRQLANVAHDNDDGLTWLLLCNLAVDVDRCTRWSTALAEYAIEQRAGNRDVLQRWVARWTPRAEAAAAGLGQLFEQLPSGGRSAKSVEDAANSARRRVLNQAGLSE
jgi:toluene monooxygenase system protein E